MIFKLYLVTVIVLAVFGEQYTPGSNEYLLQTLSPLLNPLNGLLFDGPSSASNARTTTRNRNKLPTLEQMQYYNYYAASMYYGYGHANLTCDYCLKFKKNVVHHRVIPNNMHNTLALITLSKNRKEIVVAFRGTWNVWNVILDVLLINGREGNSPKQIKVHQGFYIAAMSLYDDVVRAVAEYLRKNPGFKVVIVGHSLGGAMARLIYFFLEDCKQFPEVTYELYTYGEPRVGNRYFADFMNSRSITTARVVARADLVPHFPPTSIVGLNILGDYYIQPQTEFWINGEKGQKFCCQTVYEDPECGMSMGPAYSVLDHGVYFDTNLGSILGQPLLFAHLPLNLLNPVDVLPPLPKPIENLIGGLASGVVGALVPALG
ncbi:lipase-like [Bradysia coprophila]|uniref:lipase-like n=1 Tax=Bradysia coprophila TaxID=38358 RepID=UPI00187DB381|nr:lipase-like [Bradysia coprophila]